MIIIGQYDYAIAIYKEVLVGKRDKFPRHFWKEEYETAPFLVRYLIEELLQWDDEQIAREFTSSVLEEYKLAGLLKYVYQKNMYAVIEDAYPNRFLPWELRSVPNQFWHDKQNCIDATRWLINEKKKWNKDDIMKLYNSKVFKEEEMTGLLKWGWNGDTFRAISCSFLEHNFQPWEIEKVPINHLTQKEAIEAIRWYIEEKEKWTKDELYDKWRSRNIPNTIRRVIKQCFDNNMFLAIDKVYPHTFFPWDFPLPKRYWDKEHKEEARNWLDKEIVGKSWSDIPVRTILMLQKISFFQKAITSPTEGDNVSWR